MSLLAWSASTPPVFSRSPPTTSPPLRLLAPAPRCLPRPRVLLCVLLLSPARLHQFDRHSVALKRWSNDRWRRQHVGRRLSAGIESPTIDATCFLRWEFQIYLVGTDEVTTCVGVVIRNNKTGITSISHMDFPRIVEGGLKQMLELLGDDNAPFDVHLIGGFDDTSTKVAHSSGRKHSIQEGYSYPLCCKIVEALHMSQKQFHLRSFCVLENNTITDSYGNARPIIGGFVVQTSSGIVTPASFDMTSRCPDEVVRRIRVSVSSYDPSWQGRLLETYDTHADSFRIAPACWMPDWAEIASSLNQLSDSEVLLQCSTSPAAEPPHFVENERRIWKYLIDNPDWEETFPKYKARVFQRTSDGRWSRHS